MSEIAVLGAGSWGTALAIHLAHVGHTAPLWARRRELAEELASTRRNVTYLPEEAELPPGVEPTADLDRLASCRRALMVVPSHGYREVLRRYLEVVEVEGVLDVVSCTKGIETESLERMSEVTAAEADRAGREVRFGVLSGPSFAAELAVGRPTAAVIASRDPELAREVQAAMSSKVLRLYSSQDVVGVELGGTAKNVIAIAAGVVAGLELGHNAMAALITRGLHEITRLGMAFGGELRTFSGLAGLGDLVLTCTGGLSRNRRTGQLLAEGQSMEEATGGTLMVSEGVRNSLAVSRLARRREIEMPITEQMVQVLYEGKSAARTVEELMTRELKAEAEL